MCVRTCARDTVTTRVREMVDTSGSTQERTLHSKNLVRTTFFRNHKPACHLDLERSIHLDLYICVSMRFKAAGVDSEQCP